MTGWALNTKEPPRKQGTELEPELELELEEDFDRTAVELDYWPQ